MAVVKTYIWECSACSGTGVFQTCERGKSSNADVIYGALGSHSALRPNCGQPAIAVKPAPARQSFFATLRQRVA